MNFTKTKEIGRGGYGIVELADCDDGHQYALKTLNYGTLGEADRALVKKRFEREIRYQSAVNHPNVVTVVAHNLEDDPPWFVMPLATASLKDDLVADKTLGGNPAPPLFDILSGLEAVHNKGFSHRDLKPANVLKFEEEGKVVYKISDFGLTTPGAGQTTTLTGSNMQGGTVLYRPPECANNFRRATAQADIYSFGAVLYDILSPNPARVPHSELTVPGSLGAIIEKCTKSQPRRRYRSVAALREELFRVLSTEQVQFFSQEEESVAEVFRDNETLTDEQWDQTFNLIDDNEDKGESNANLMRALRLSHISSLHGTAPDMFNALGEIYAGFA